MIVDNNYNKWNINKLPRVKGAQGATGSTGVVTLNSGNREGTGYPELEAHYLWGQFFNGKQDVNGDITTDGDVNFYGNLNFMGEYNPDDDLHGNLNIGNVNADNGHFKEMNADILKAAEAYINNLTVTGSAHFFELIIDKIRSVGGAIMLTPGDGFELWGYNLSTLNNINLWWVYDDIKGSKYNHWVVGDQALCKSFDAAIVGKSTNVSNKNWWAKVVAVNDTPRWCVKLGENEYNPDEVMVLPIGNDNAYYTNTHSYLRKSDFIETSDYVYVETAQRTHWITNEEYFALDDSVKPNYEYSQLYIHQNDDGSVLQITQLQYENSDIDEVDLLIYDEKEDDWRVLRQFCKADCKYCYGITIDKTQCKSGSVFSVTENNNTAWVFQEGDNIVMLGNQTDENRQNAIYLNAGGQGDSLDTDLRPPFIAQYKGIGSQGIGETAQDRFNLEKRKLTWFSGGSTTQGVFANEIKGNLKIMSSDPNVDGENVQDYVNSQLIVAEDHITAEVLSEVNGELNRTGIDIEDGTITLDALKTIITGVLQLNDSQSGLVLYDNNGNPVISIQNTSVGGVDSVTFLNYAFDELRGSQSHNYIHVYPKSETTFGLISGKQYSIDNISLMVYIDDVNIPSIQNVVANAYIKKKSDDTTITTLFTNKTVNGTSGSDTINLGGPYTFTSNYTGSCYIYVDVTVNFNQSYTSDLFAVEAISSITSLTDTIMKIGSDGVVFVNSATQYAMFKSNEYEFKQGSNILTMDTNNIKRTIGSSESDISSIMPVRIVDIGVTPYPSAQMHVFDTDGLIVITGSYSGGDPYFYLEAPASFNVGKTFKIKNLSNKDIYLSCNDLNHDYFVYENSKTQVNEYHMTDNGLTVISDGNRWLVFK